MSSPQKSLILLFRKPGDSTTYIQQILGVFIDDLLDPDKRKPIIPHDWEIVACGVGSENLKEYYLGKHSDLVELDPLER